MYLASFSGFDGIYWRDARRSSPLFSPLIFYSCFFYLYRFVHLFCLENNKHVVVALSTRRLEEIKSDYWLQSQLFNPPGHLYDIRSIYEAGSTISTSLRRRQQYGRRRSSAYGDSVRRKPYGKIWTNWRLRLVPCYELSGVWKQPLLAVEDLMIACPLCSLFFR